MPIPLLVLCLLAAALLGACGSDDPEPAPRAGRTVETAHELPKLPRGWTPYANAAAGFALGRPPGWAVQGEGIVARLTAPDELVAMTLSADRTSEALALEPGDYATQTLAALEGYERPLEPSAARPFPHRYEAAQTHASGVAAGSGVRQDVRVVVIRRAGLATVTAVMAANAKRAPAAEVADALQALRTLRTRPVR